MKSIECELLKDKQIEQLYDFVKKHSINNYNSNKAIDNSVLWNIIYLRKLIKRTLYYSKRSSKHKLKFDYVIFNKSEVVCFFSLTMKREDVWELSVISEFHDDIKSNEAIMKCIITQFNSAVDKDVKFPICSLYINENARHIEKLFMEHTSYFKHIFVDELTYIEKYNVLYYIGGGSGSESVSNEGVNVVDARNEQYVYDTLQNVYNLSKVMEEPVSKQSVRKLTVKLQTPMKIITKDIFDIKEIQNRPEFEGYDYSKIIFIKDSSFIFNIINSMNIDIVQFITNRFFNGNKIYNERLFNLYKYGYKYINNINYNTLLDIYRSNTIFNTSNINFKENTLFHNYIISNIIKNIINKNNNLLIITNSIDDIISYKEYNIDIICLKQQTDKIKERHYINKIKTNIKFCFNNLAYHNQITNYILNGRTFEIIYINTMYLNYDYIISNINIIVKLPFFLYTILNSLKILKKNGSLIIQVFIGNLNIPIIQKILDILLNIFENYKINYLVDYRMIIKFEKYIGTNKNKYLNIINDLIKQINKFEKDEFSIDDVVSCILSNKFYYKVNNEILENIKITPINKKILYDISSIKLSNNSKLHKFNDEYNKILNNNENQMKTYYKLMYNLENNINEFYNYIIKNYNNRLLILLYYMLKYKITDNYIVKDLIDNIIKKHKSIKNYINII